MIDLEKNNSKACSPAWRQHTDESRCQNIFFKLNSPLLPENSFECILMDRSERIIIKTYHWIVPSPYYRPHGTVIVGRWVWCLKTSEIGDPKISGQPISRHNNTTQYANTIQYYNFLQFVNINLLIIAYMKNSTFHSIILYKIYFWGRDFHFGRKWQGVVPFFSILRFYVNSQRGIMLLFKVSHTVFKNFGISGKTSFSGRIFFSNFFHKIKLLAVSHQAFRFQLSDIEEISWALPSNL